MDENVGEIVLAVNISIRVEKSKVPKISGNNIYKETNK